MGLMTDEDIAQRKIDSNKYTRELLTELKTKHGMEHREALVWMKQRGYPMLTANVREIKQ